MVMSLFARKVAAVLGITLAGMGAGCGGGSEKTEEPNPFAATPSTSAISTSMTLNDNSYSPNTLASKVGQPVSLSARNAGQAAHTFTIDGLVDDTRPMNKEATRLIQFTATAAGTYTYYCVIHGKSVMSGTLTVSP
jgi:plastocyanin